MSAVVIASAATCAPALIYGLKLGHYCQVPEEPCAISFGSLPLPLIRQGWVHLCRHQHPGRSNPRWRHAYKLVQSTIRRICAACLQRGSHLKPQCTRIAGNLALAGFEVLQGRKLVLASVLQASTGQQFICRSASFATPAHVRKEWAEEHGLTAFQSSEYDSALEAVSKRLGVTTGKGAHLGNQGCQTSSAGLLVPVDLLLLCNKATQMIKTSMSQHRCPTAK